jgi:phytoene synthase
MTTSIVACRAAIERHSASFALAARLLPAHLGADAAVAYAFCRRADDAIDLVSPEQQPAALARLRAELDRVYGGEALVDPVLAAFQGVVQRRGVPREYPEALLDGIEMDVLGASYPDHESLLVYCFRVAGAVGLMMSHVLGVRSPEALPHAAHLGMAMQLTNVCRDVSEDWERGRLYIPRELLRGVAPADLAPAPGRPIPEAARAPLAEATALLLDRADALYRSGDRGIPLLSFRSAVAVRTARHVYADIGRVIRENDCDPCAPRAVVPRRRKIALAAGSLLQSLLDVPARFRPVELHGAVVFRDVVPV